MKSLRKILAVLVATAMVAGMGAIAFAGVGSITITENQAGGKLNGRTLTAYRILDATYASGTSGVTTIAYSVPPQLIPFYESQFPNYSGSDQQKNGESFEKYVVDQIAALSADGIQNFIKAFADQYTGSLSGTYVKEVTANENSGSVKFEGLPSGYYVIVDKGTKEPVSALMLDTVLNENVDIILKANKEVPNKSILGPSGPIPVRDDSGTLMGYLNDANELSAGSTVNYVVQEHVPNYAGYEHFYFILNDTLSKGLTYNTESGVKVYIDIDGNGSFADKSVTYTLPNDKPSGTEVMASGTTKGPRSETLEEGKDYYVYVTYNTDGTTGIKVAFDKIQNFPVNAPIMITYAANLNKDAITGINSNTNEAKLQYSNRHKSGTSGTPRDDGPSGVPASGTDKILDEGPKDWTDTFTTEIKVLKKDSKSGSLKGAQFTLTGNSTQYVVKNQIVYTEDPYGPFYMTKSGTYTTDKPSAPSMDPAPSGASAGYVKVNDANDNPANDKERWITMPNGDVYRPYVRTNDNGRPIYILMPGTEDKYASTIITYRSGTAPEYSGTSVPVTMVLGGSGTELNEFLFNQLGAGKYTITETKVPDGYNKAPDINFEIDWELVQATDDSHSGTCRWTISGTQAGKTVTFVESPSGSGKFVIDIVNNNGVELPSTGGIGTTIFYAGGAILVLLAGILLVSKRRFA